MRWGLIARSERDRGLGIQTYEMYRNLKPDKTLVVNVPKSGFVAHPKNFPGATFVKLENTGRLGEVVVRDWWKDLDVVVSVETMYDWRLIEWAKADNVKTVIHGNPEFWMASNPQPDVWWWPTTWRLEHLPAGPVVPVPVPEHPRVAADPFASGGLKCVHVAGNAAMYDRNGTHIVGDAFAQKAIPPSARLDIYHQAPVRMTQRRNVTYLGPAPDKWDLYKGYHAMILPRKYGGLCLPALEAMRCGLAVVMPDCSPNDMWPVVKMATAPHRAEPMQTGLVQTFHTQPRVVAETVQLLDRDREALARVQRLGIEFAEANGWDQLRDKYYEQIDLAVR